MAVTTSTSATIRGISYTKGQSFTCYYSAKGTTTSEGSGTSIALTKGSTYYFIYKATGDSNNVTNPYAVSTSSSTSGIQGWYTESVFPYATYTVSFNANGGSGAPSSQTKTYGTTLTLSSTKPTRSGYTFLGWSTSSTATSATYSAGGSYTANSGATLYAVWKLAYTAPSAPSSISITKNSNTSATVGWTNNAATYGGLTGTKIYRETDGSLSSTNLNSTTSSTQTSFTDTGITTNHRYRYKLEAYNDYGSTSAYTGYIYTAPAAPSAAYGMNNSGTVTLSASVSNINWGSTYTWQRSQDKSTWTTLSLTSASGTDTHSLSGDVYYRVRAVAPDGTTGSYYTFLCGNKVSLYFWIPG